ncbi:hypothetical protein EMPG_15498 [Blastomyces silverae]|uniref:Uncharacterized protein n=1 Tax=Blastomyces silverae TaxID=2060906 RepID=A0A0H1BC92_9EURO|nr:hypothetical protein EMPG_15498 [Blastomyces silverae]
MIGILGVLRTCRLRLMLYRTGCRRWLGKGREWLWMIGLCLVIRMEARERGSFSHISLIKLSRLRQFRDTRRLKITCHLPCGMMDRLLSRV